MERKTKRNRKRNGTENKNYKMKVSKENKYMNSVDTTAYKGKRFEIKQNLDFYSHIKTTKH